MRLKQISRKVIFIFTALPLIETSLSLSVYCLVSPNPTCPHDTTQNVISLAISASNLVVLFNREQEIKLPLTSGRKGKEVGEERSVPRVESMTFRSCELVDVLDRG